MKEENKNTHFELNKRQIPNSLDYEFIVYELNIRKL